MKVPLTPSIDVQRWDKNGDHTHDLVGQTAFDPLAGGGTYIRTEGALVRYYRHPWFPGEKTCPVCSIEMHAHGYIEEGEQVVCPGDFIVSVDMKTFAAVKPRALGLMLYGRTINDGWIVTEKTPTPTPDTITIEVGLDKLDKDAL
jgi:hypothetical protein